MRSATKEQPPIAQAENVRKTGQSPAGADKQHQDKQDWIEHRDWRGEGVVGERHTD